MFNSALYESKQFKTPIENVNDSNSAILSVLRAIKKIN